MDHSDDRMELYAQKALLRLSGDRELLSAGMAGVVQVYFSCSEDWDGLQKTAVFSNGSVSVDVPESAWEDGGCTVPQEVLACAGKTVFAGLYGSDGEQLILPTIWCSLGRVEAGTVPSCHTTAPAQAPIWAQLGQRISALEAQPQQPEAQISAENLSQELLAGIGRCCVTITQSNDLYHTDRTCAEIAAAYSAGAHLYAVGPEGQELPLMYVDGLDEAVFGGITAEINAEGRRIVLYRIIESGVTRIETPISQMTVTISSGSGGQLYASKTNAEIYAAYCGGTRVECVSSEGYVLPLKHCTQTCAWFVGSAQDVSEEAAAIVNIRIEQNTVELTKLFPQSALIDDDGGYFSSQLLNEVLQEIGAELAGSNTLLGGGIE